MQTQKPACSISSSGHTVQLVSNRSKYIRYNYISYWRSIKYTGSSGKVGKTNNQDSSYSLALWNVPLEFYCAVHNKYAAVVRVICSQSKDFNLKRKQRQNVWYYNHINSWYSFMITFIQLISHYLLTSKKTKI